MGAIAIESVIVFGAEECSRSVVIVLPINNLLIQVLFKIPLVNLK